MLGAADKEEERGSVGRGLDGAPQASRAKAGSGDAWARRLHGPRGSRALAGPGSTELSQVPHCKVTSRARIKAWKPIRSLEKSGLEH